jgi:hypothetical protein
MLKLFSSAPRKTYINISTNIQVNSYSTSKIAERKSSSGVVSEFAQKYPAVYNWVLDPKTNHIKKLSKYELKKPHTGNPKPKPTHRRFDRVITMRKIIGRNKVKELFAKGLISVDGKLAENNAEMVSVNLVFEVDGVTSHPILV